MKRNISKYPLRILLVEDDEDVREDCADQLRRMFPKAIIEKAASRDEARALILAAYHRGAPYDVAIIDLQLPESVGGLDVRDTSVASFIIEKFGVRVTRLVQWTAYPEDRAVADFRREKDIPRSGIVYQVISKRDLDWPAKLEEFIKRTIAEISVGQWLDDPYFRQMRGGGTAIVTRHPAATRAPLDIPAYVQAVLDVWPLLEHHRRLEAQNTFRNTEWEIVEASGQARLAHARTAQALTEAQDNARIFAQVMSRDKERP